MKPRMESNTSSPVVVGVDIGKNVFHLVGFTADRKIAFPKGAGDTHARSIPASLGKDSDTPQACVQQARGTGKRSPKAAERSRGPQLGARGTDARSST